MSVRFELATYPVIVVRFPPAGPDSDIDVWYDAVETYLEQADAPIAFIDDLRALEFGETTAVQRRIAAARHLRLAERFAAKHAGNARVVEGPLARAILRVFDWLSPAPWPVAVFAHLEDAIAWSTARVLEARSAGASP